MKKIIIIATIISFLSYSCLSPKKIEKSYQLFQTGLDSLANFTYKELRIKEGDNLTIQVITLASNDQAQVMVFNLPGGAGKPGVLHAQGVGAGDQGDRGQPAHPAVAVVHESRCPVHRENLFHPPGQQTAGHEQTGAGACHGESDHDTATDPR